jgi:hypothetical protein
MQPTKIDNRQEDIFRGRLSNELNPKDEMMILSRLIPRDSLESEFSDLYQSSGNIGSKMFGKSLNSDYLKNDIKIPLPPKEIQQNRQSSC